MQTEKLGILWDTMGQHGRQWEVMVIVGFYLALHGLHGPAENTKKPPKRRLLQKYTLHIVGEEIIKHMFYICSLLGWV